MKARRAVALAAAIALAAGGGAGLAGCAKAQRDAPERVKSAPAAAAPPMAMAPHDAAPAGRAAGAPEPTPVNPTLLAFLSKARAAHHAADLAGEDGDLEASLAALEPVVAGRRPDAPEAVEVVADTLARMAEIEGELERFDAALAHIDAGLGLAKTPTHFRGHLLEVKGVVLEQRYRSLDARGEVAEAGVAKARALEAFRAAIDVQDQVIREALDSKRP